MTPNKKKSIATGAFAGFIAGTAFTGVMLWLPVISHLPAGIFLNALGLSITSIGNGSNAVGVVSTGLAAFGIILSQCIFVGVIFGIVTSKSKRFQISNKKRSVAFGIATCIISYLVLFVPFTYTIYPRLLFETINIFSRTALFSIQGSQGNLIPNSIPVGEYIPSILGYSIFAYLVFGFILGGILKWMYSIYNFDLTRAKELEKIDKR